MIKYFALTSALFAAALTACASAPANSQSRSEPVPRIKPEAAKKPVTAPVITPNLPPKILTTAPIKLGQTERFNVWKKGFISRALAKGYDRQLLADTIGQAKINPKAIYKEKNQPEFTRPVWAYIDSAANATRLKGGKAKLAKHDQLFSDLEQKYGVSRHIITGIWGLESAYGTIMGDDDMIDSLSTLAFEGRRAKFGEQQLFGILELLARGEVRQDQLSGSWAGAMGMTQFIPTTFRDYAVDYDGDGNKDLWHNEGDALASTASYLNRFGWRGTEPVYTEVILPQGFDFTQSNGVDGKGIKRTVAGWSGLGIRSVTGKNWSQEALFLEAKLLMPAGAKGPVFLTFKNFDVLKKYNNSDSYAIGITVLADTLQSKPGFKRDWPRSDKPLSLTDRKNLQRALTRQGYDTKGIDGVLGRNSRKAIRAWQTAHRIPADGYVNQVLLKKILAG